MVDPYYQSCYCYEGRNVVLQMMLLLMMLIIFYQYFLFLRFDEHIGKKGRDLIFTFLPLIHKSKGCVWWCERIWYTVVKYNSTRFRFKEQIAVCGKKVLLTAITTKKT